MPRNKQLSDTNSVTTRYCLLIKEKTFNEYPNVRSHLLHTYSILLYCNTFPFKTYSNLQTVTIIKYCLSKFHNSRSLSYNLYIELPVSGYQNVIAKTISHNLISKLFQN